MALKNARLSEACAGKLAWRCNAGLLPMTGQVFKIMSQEIGTRMLKRGATARC